MESIIYKASERGHQDHGWLNTKHTFSFADYYNPNRINFGALRVVNDDIVSGGTGFGKHPHDNMEIVSIPIYGALEHKDSMGHKSIISTGEIQVMSAGSGLFHSEYNSDPHEPLNFFQIWIFPNEKNVTPRYDQKAFDFTQSKNKLTEVISPNRDGNNLWLHQDTWFNLGVFDKGIKVDYELNKLEDGVFCMVIEGEFLVEDHTLQKRDAIGIWDVNSLKIESLSDNAKILLIEVPMLF